VDELSQKLTAEITENLVVRAEDARMMNVMN